MVRVKSDRATIHALWVAIRTSSYVPPRPPEPNAHQLMLFTRIMDELRSQVELEG